MAKQPRKPETAKDAKNLSQATNAFDALIGDAEIDDVTGLAGTPDKSATNVLANKDSPLSGNDEESPATSLETDDSEAALLQEDMDFEQSTRRQSGKSGKSAKKSTSGEKGNAPAADPYDGFDVLIRQGQALKLNPKTQNHIFFDVAMKQDDKALYLRMSGNEGGGLHSKEWLALEPILQVIEQNLGQSFKSTVFNHLFKGASANNAGFLGAVLRAPALGLLQASELALYQHQVPADYAAKKAALRALEPSKGSI